MAQDSQEDLWNSVLKEREGQQPEPTDEATPAAEEAPAGEQQETQPEQAAADAESQQPAQEADPLEGLPPAVREKLASYDKLAELVPKLISDIRSTQGRFAHLQSQWNKAQEVASKPTQKQVEQAKTPEEWDALKEQFPDWGTAIEKFVESKAGQAPSGFSAEDIEQIVSQRTQVTTEALERQFNEKLVTLRHPTWRQTTQTPEFVQWLTAQPEEVKRLADSTDGLDAIDLLDRYSAGRKLAQDRASKLEAAATTVNRRAPVKTSKTVEDMTPEELWNYEAARRQSRRA